MAMETKDSLAAGRLRIRPVVAGTKARGVARYPRIAARRPLIMANGSKLKVAFTILDGVWLGGFNYFRNLIGALRSHPNLEIEPLIFTGNSSSDDKVASEFASVQIVRTSLLARRSPAWFMRKAIHKTSSRDLPLELLLRRSEVSVLSHSRPLGRGSSIATSAWIPDFQHLHLPQFFTEKERRLRSRGLKELSESCDRLILSSQCAKDDLRSFAPQHVHKAAVLRFVATPSLAGDNDPELHRRYTFGNPYFLLPNQFWAHKNHRTVISALKLLKGRNRRVLVLATGPTSDYRDPGFFESLMEYAKQSDVLDCFRVLGVLPFREVSALMRDAVALINPSRFEGWSTTVEESKSLGKRILLSSIPVHREQSPELGVYFDPDDVEALAEAMWGAVQSFDPVEDRGRQMNAQVRLPSRQMEFAETFQRIATDAALSRPGRSS